MDIRYNIDFLAISLSLPDEFRLEFPHLKEGHFGVCTCIWIFKQYIHWNASKALTGWACPSLVHPSNPSTLLTGRGAVVQLYISLKMTVLFITVDTNQEALALEKLIQFVYDICNLIKLYWFYSYDLRQCFKIFWKSQKLLS